MTESLLDQALDQIKRGRTNEGFRAWEALFPKLCEEEGLIYGLAMKIELVEALRGTEHKLAKRTCQEILNQIYENEDKNHLSKDANWDTLSNLAWEIYDMLSGDEVLDPSDASIQVVQDEVQPASPRKLQPMMAWPKMPRNVISTEALREFGLNHEVRNDNVIIFSILTEDEVADLVLRSIEIRRERSLAQRTHAPVSVGSRPGPSKYLDFSPSQRPQAGNSEAFRDESPAVSEEVLNHLDSGTPLGIKQASQGTGLSRSALDANGVLLTLNSSIQNSDIWLNNFSTTQQRLKSDLGPHPQCGRKIKIAILDTGCNIDDPYFLSNGMDRVEGLKNSWHDMLDESPTPVDLDAGKHGTALAILLLQLAPDAEVHVIRIARDSSQIASAKATVEEAIRLAADEKDVDIISMSFGFQKDIGVIQSALTAAEVKKDHKILFFAAANNDGLNDPERYPARSEAVISVRGTDHAGIMVGQYNPGNWEQNPGDQLCTLAKNVPCGFLAPKSGCSVATPILAAIAANIIAFVDCSSHFSEDERAIVRQRRGILQVFREMARFQRPAADRLYVAPWHLYEGSRKPHTVISYALSNLPQRE